MDCIHKISRVEVCLKGSPRICQAGTQARWEFLAPSQDGAHYTAAVCPLHQDAAAAAAKSPQSCPTLCDPTDGSPPGFPIPGTLQARTLEWVAISFSNAWKWKVNVKSLSHVRLLATSWTADYQAPPSMGFSRQEYWSGVPLPSPWRPNKYWMITWLFHFATL